MLYKNNKLFLSGTNYHDKKTFQNLIDKLFKMEWVVYIKESFNDSESVIKYLSKYTHRIAISNHRIKKLENDKSSRGWVRSSNQALEHA